MAMYGKDQFHKATSEGGRRGNLPRYRFPAYPEDQKMTEYPGDLMHVKMFPAVDR